MALEGQTFALGSFDLTVARDTLLVRDNSLSTKSKPNRTCFGSGGAAKETTRSIPLYNILWAQVDDDNLTIDYAEDTTKGRVRAAKITIPLRAAATTSTHAGKPPGSSSMMADADQDSRSPDKPSASAAAATWAASLLDRSYHPEATRQKRAFIIVNPHAGPGGATRKFESQVKPIFNAARMALDVVTTTRQGEAEQVVEKLDLEKYDVIAVASGDGLVYEVFNGLGRRPDAQRALSSVAVVHIPCGSGNAMACNLYGTHRPSAAALAAVKGVPTPLDLVSVTQGQRRSLSFLSQALGVIAESDLATDDLRWMGSARFTYGYLTRVFKRAVYPCDISVKVEIDDKSGIKQHYSRHRSNSAAARANAGAGNGLNGNGGGGDGLPPLKYGTINDKVPEGWETFSYDNMGQLYCGNMAYMMPENNIFAAACINDGLIDLVTVDGDISPFKSIELMLLVENGKFFDDPRVRYRKVSAYRITPRNQTNGYISIDGERVPFEPFQCEVHRGLGLVLSKAGVYEAPGPLGWEKIPADLPRAVPCQVPEAST